MHLSERSINLGILKYFNSICARRDMTVIIFQRKAVMKCIEYNNDRYYLSKIFIMQTLEKDGPGKNDPSEKSRML